LINPLEELQRLIIRQRHLMREYNITNSEVYDINYWLDWNEREVQQMAKIMNDEIAKYPIYMVNKLGGLVRIYNIKSTKDYNHYTCNLHHFIPYHQYIKKPEWYAEQGIEQKLILMSIPMHEQLHNQAVKVLSDSEFHRRYRIEKSKLIYRNK